MTLLRCAPRGVLAASLFLAACGSTTTEVGEFQQLVIGPDGGHLEAQNVAADVPPGAFTEDHVCAVLEQPTPLPIEEQEDGSTIAYHDNIMCIGPIALELLVPGYARMCYPVESFPKGLGESDLVLLEWNEELGVMQVVEDAFQNLDTHCFEDFSYEHFGHIAVGIRTPGDEEPDFPEFEFVFFGGFDDGGKGEFPAGRILTSNIVLVDLDGELPTTDVPSTSSAREYLPNGPGDRVLYTTPFFEDKFEQRSLRTFDVPSLADREVVPQDQFTPFDPLFGWFGRTDTIYFHRFFVQTFGDKVDNAALSTVPGGGGAFTDVYPYDSNQSSFFDVRISNDGSMALLRFFDFNDERERIAVVDTLGNILTNDLDPTTSFYVRTPRFLPDGSGIYFVAEDGITIKRFDVDGTDGNTLYTLTVLNSSFLDFTVAPPFAPDPQRCAYIRRQFGVFSEGLNGTGAHDLYETDNLSGGDVQSYDFETTISFVDLVPLYSTNWQTSLVFLQYFPQNSVDTQGVPNGASFQTTLVFGLGAPGPFQEIPAPLAHIDLSRQAFFPEPVRAGEMLVWVNQTDTELFPDYPVSGIYHLDAFAANPTLVTPPGYFVDGPPRWLQSWRYAPGFNTFSEVR